MTNLELLGSLRCFQRSWLHSFWPASWGWGGHQGSELSEAAWCHRTHYSQVCKQPEPKDQPGAAVPALSVTQSKVPRTPRTAGTTLQVKGAHQKSIMLLVKLILLTLWGFWILAFKLSHWQYRENILCRSSSVLWAEYIIPIITFLTLGHVADVGLPHNRV